MTGDDVTDGDMAAAVLLWVRQSVTPVVKQNGN
jgi:hypothetical protein